MAKNAKKNHGVDPHWPADDYEDNHPVTELTADRQGALSPWGDITFPIEDAGYVHPSTEINWDIRR